MYCLTKKNKNYQIAIINNFPYEPFESIREASEKYNIDSSSISKCCKNKQKTAGKHPKTEESLIWVYLKDFNQVNSKEKIKNFNNRKNLPKPIIQLTLDGEFIAEYPSINKAGKLTGFNPKNISACCTGRYKTSYGYLWEYKNNN